MRQKLSKILLNLLELLAQLFDLLGRVHRFDERDDSRNKLLVLLQPFCELVNLGPLADNLCLEQSNPLIKGLGGGLVLLGLSLALLRKIRSWQAYGEEKAAEQKRKQEKVTGIFHEKISHEIPFPRNSVSNPLTRLLENSNDIKL